MLLMREGDLAGAEREFVQVIGLATENLGAGHPYVLIFSNNYGECLTLMHRYADAEPLLLRTQAALGRLMGVDNARTAKAGARLRGASTTRCSGRKTPPNGASPAVM